ncbi:integrase, catalytic region, zinc finger, CCHC-type containing protein [Tanacetum coccineum]
MFDEDAPEDQPNIAIVLDSISELVEKHNRHWGIFEGSLFLHSLSNDTEQINATFAQLNQMYRCLRDLLTGSRDSNLYTISIYDLAASSPVCLMYKATSTKSWLWHRRLSHLNFGTINHLTKKDLVDGLPKFKYDKDHLCLACE